jgi:hypothetical protein
MEDLNNDSYYMAKKSMTQTQNPHPKVSRYNVEG